MKFSTAFNQYVLPAGLFTLAAALIFFTLELASIRRAIPSFIEGVKEVEDKLDPVLEEVEEIRMLVPALIEQVDGIRAEIPSILEEVALIRSDVVPMVIAQVAEVSEQIPKVITEVDQLTEKIPPILEESAQLRSQIPALLEESKAYREIAQTALGESEEYRVLIPKILTELETMREVIPEYIDEANILVDNISTAGQSAAEGATKGFFTGIIKAPFSLVGGAGESLFPSATFTDEDKKYAEVAIATVLGSPDSDTFDVFENPDTGVTGEVHVIKVSTKKRKTCKELRITARRKNKEIVNKSITLCRSKDGKWELVK